MLVVTCFRAAARYRTTAESRTVATWAEVWAHLRGCPHGHAVRRR